MWAVDLEHLVDGASVLSAAGADQADVVRREVCACFQPGAEEEVAAADRGSRRCWRGLPRTTRCISAREFRRGALVGVGQEDPWVLEWVWRARRCGGSRSRRRGGCGGGHRRRGRSRRWRRWSARVEDVDVVGPGDRRPARARKIALLILCEDEDGDGGGVRILALMVSWP